MKNLLNNPINEVKFLIKNDQSLIELSSKLSNKDGRSNIKIEINDRIFKKILFCILINMLIHLIY